MQALTSTVRAPVAQRVSGKGQAARGRAARACALRSPARFEGLSTHAATFGSKQAPSLASVMKQISQSRSNTKAANAVRAQTVCAAAEYDYDLVIIGCGVGGHGAAIHATECGLKTAVIEGHDVGGTCVNRGCVPSKALLAASGRVREMQSDMHLKAMGVQVGAVSFDRQGIADHATNLANTIQGNLARSLTAMGVDLLEGTAKFIDNHTLQYAKQGRVDVGGTVTAKNIIIATGSVPFVPPGIEIDGKTVFTSDHALKLEWLPEWVAIIGSGYIGLEFADVYTALGTEVTFIEAMDKIMPGFDGEIAKLAERTLITPRNIDYTTGVLASKVTPGIPGVKPVEVTLTDFKTKEVVDTMEVDAVLVATGRAPYTQGLNLGGIKVSTDRRGFVPVDDHMNVVDDNGKAVPNVFCIGDANGKYMLAHAASAQGISAVENMMGREHKVNHLSIPAACFTHPEVSFVGLTEEQARAQAEEGGYADKVAVTKTSFKANTKALAEGEPDGLCKLIYRSDNGEILGAHIFGLHAADLIHEVSNAVAQGLNVYDIKYAVHSHPTLSEVVDECFKQTHADIPVPHAKAEPAKKVAAAK